MSAFIETCGVLLDHYDGFLLDQWGVLHDGYKPYPGVIACLEEMQARGKRVIILSNAGTRAAHNVQRMSLMGIGPNLYQDIITSGEVAADLLTTKDHPALADLGPNVYIISQDGLSGLLDENSGACAVPDVMLADFILLSGTDSGRKTLDDYKDVLHTAHEMGLPIICSNPDAQCILGHSMIMTPGTLAAYYESLGGTVHYIGKPHPLVYEICLARLAAKGVVAERTIMIGDSLAYDIAGGAMAGIDTCLVLSGLHRLDFAHCHTPSQRSAQIKELAAQMGTPMPSYIAESLTL
jgi:HAD superfamily hydrolase (TIGR01459 family)